MCERNFTSLSKQVIKPAVSSSTFICITGWGAAQPEEYCGVYNALHKTDMYSNGILPHD